MPSSILASTQRGFGAWQKMPHHPVFFPRLSALISEFDVHGEIIIDCWNYAGNEFQENKESKVMPRSDFLRNPILHNLFHNLCMFTWVDGHSGCACQRVRINCHCF